LLKLREVELKKVLLFYLIDLLLAFLTAKTPQAMWNYQQVTCSRTTAESESWTEFCNLIIFSV